VFFSPLVVVSAPERLPRSGILENVGFRFFLNDLFPNSFNLFPPRYDSYLPPLRRHVTVMSPLSLFLTVVLSLSK